jgi:hypothetical protein
MLVVAGALIVDSPAADAATSAKCSAYTESRSYRWMVQWRTVVNCSSIGSTTKVRGKLALQLLPDDFTDWFTVTNTNKYTFWHEKIPFTSNPTAGYEVANR